MVRRLYPFEPELAHCRRVAAWAWLIARRENLEPSLLEVLQTAAERHHEPGSRFTRDGLRRLFAEIGGAPGGVPAMAGTQADGAEALAASLREACSAAPGPRAVPIERLLQVLEAAHVFDECLEALPYELRPIGELLDDAVSLSPDPAWPPLLDVFRHPLAFTGIVLDSAMACVPVNPELVARAAAVASDPDSELVDLERVASRDPVLAAALLRAANSARQALHHRVSTLSQAINLLGLDESRQIVLAAAVRPAFVDPAARPLWPHSLEVASLAAAIARRTAEVSPSEAFLAGLLHDFGRLLMLASPEPALSAYPCLLARGCPPVAAELALCGVDHAEIGAQALERWQIAEAVCEAVRQHHRTRPDSSLLGALLQLAEEIAAAGEDLPSLPRLRDSLQTLQLPAGILSERTPGIPAALRVLREEP